MEINFPDGLSQWMVPTDDMVIHMWRTNGDFEPEVGKTWREILKTAHVVMDIGAYTGWYTLQAELRGVRCMAFEPNPVVFERLKTNCMANAVEPFFGLYAVGNCGFNTSHSQFTFDPRLKLTSGGGLKGTRGNQKATDAEETVKVFSIDAIMSEHAVDAMKIDVEGGEFDVLKGAEALIARCHPTIIVELLNRAAVHQVEPWLAKRGYSGTKLDPTNWLFQYASQCETG